MLIALLVASLGAGARAFAGAPVAPEAPEAGLEPSESAQPGPGDSEPTPYHAVVRVARPAGSASEHRVEGPGLHLTPARSTDALLQQVPGLLVVRHGAEGKGQQLFLRGFDAAHGSDVDVRVAGLPVNEVSNVHGHGYVDLHFVPPEVVSSLTVLPGPFALRQGDFATAGSVHLGLGVDPAQRGARLSYEAGLTQRHRLVALYAPVASESFVVAEALRDGGAGQDRQSERVVLLGRLSSLGGARGPTLLAGAHAGRFGSPTVMRLDDWQAGRVDFGDSYLHGLQGTSTRAFVAAKQRGRAGGGRWSWQLGAQGRRFELETNHTGWLHDGEQGDTRRQRHDALTGVATVDWEQRIGRPTAGLRLVSGASWRGDWLAQDEVALSWPGLQPVRTDRDARASVHHVGVPFGLRWSSLPWLALEAGARVDLFAVRLVDRQAGGQRYDHTPWALSPRVRARAPLGERLVLYTSYGRGLRSPEARAIAGADAPHEDVELSRYRGGQPEITPVDALEAGFRLRPTRTLEVSLATFGTWIEHETVFDHVSGTNLELNATRRLGAELHLSHRPLGWLHLASALTAVRARFVASGAAVPGAPSLLTTGSATVTHPCGLGLALTGLYVAPRPLAHGARGAHQLVFGLGARYRLGAVELSLEVENLLGADWREGEYHFASWFEGERSRIPTIHYVSGPPPTARAGLTVWL